MSTLLSFEYQGNFLYFEDGSSYPSTNEIEKIQIIDRTASGSLQVETLGVTIRRKTLNFSLMGKTDLDNIINWFDNIVNGGEKTFNLTDERGNEFAVKILDNILQYTETDFELYSVVINVEVIPT